MEGEKNKALKEAFIDTWSNINLSQELEDIKSYTDNPKIFNFLDKNRDIFNNSQMSYLTMMAHRIYYMHKLLKDTGSFYLHCDPTMSHYLKILLDIIFGQKNFRNEIVWCYRTGGASKKHFSKKHDTILAYAKNNKVCLFNILKERVFYEKPFFDTKMDEKGRYYADVIITDWWEGLKPLINLSKERLGYPTQKPEKLLERIILASSKEQDVVADFFCGCGTAIAVAEKLKRKWIGADISHLAISLVEDKRLKPLKANYQIIGFPTDIAMAEKLANDNKLQFEQWIVEYILQGHCTKATGDGGIDGHVTYNMKGKKVRAVIEVKGGGISIGQIRAFKDSISKFNADFGIFIGFTSKFTKGMYEEADSLGLIQTDLSLYHAGKVKKMYILTVEDLMNKKLPTELASLSRNITY